MGRLYYSEFKSFNGTTWLCELHSSASALNHELKSLASPKFTYQGEGDKLFDNPIRASRCEISFVMRDENDYGNFVNIATSPEQEYVLKVYKNASLWWVGLVLPDQFSYNREARNVDYASITITAVDGLERLQGFDVLPGWFTSDRATFAYVTVQIINMLGLSDEFGAGTDYLRWAGQTENANTNASYGTFDAKIRDLSFVKNKDVFKDASEIEWMNCKEALEQILKAFGARIHHDEGVYWITQANAYDDSSWNYDTYDNGGLNTAYNTAYSHRLTVSDSGGRPKWEAYPEQYYQPPARAVVAEFDRVNGEIASKTTQNTTAITCTHNDITATASAPGRAVKIDIDIDFSYYATPVNKYEVHKTYYADNGSGGTKYQPIAGVWTAISGSPAADIQTYYDSSGGLMTKNFKHSVELVAPPTGQTNIVCEVKVKKVRGALAGRPSGGTYPVSWATPTTSDFEFTGTVTIMQSFSTSMPWQYVQEANYNSDVDAPRDDNSEKYELRCNYYNGKKYEIGSVLVKSGASTWIEAGNWTAPWTALAGDLPAILANQFAGIYSDYLPVIRGTLHDAGTYRPTYHLYFDSTIWVFNGGTYNPDLDIWDGEWLGIAVVYTNVNNNGEGERVQNVDEIIWDTQKELQVDLDAVRRMVGNMPLSILPTEIINNATGAPTSDPGVDKYYGVNLWYDYDATTPELKWQLNEKTQYLYEVIEIDHTDSPYTIAQLSGELLLKCDTTGGNITVNLPTAVGNKAKYHIIKTAAANAVTIDGDGSETINGSTTHGHGSQWETITIISDNANWIIIN